MARNTEADEAAIRRLEQEIARDRRRLAQRLLLAESDETPAEPPTKIGRLHRVFALMGEC